MIENLCTFFCDELNFHFIRFASQLELALKQMLWSFTKTSTIYDLYWYWWKKFWNWSQMKKKWWGRVFSMELHSPINFSWQQPLRWGYIWNCTIHDLLRWTFHEEFGIMNICARWQPCHVLDPMITKQIILYIFFFGLFILKSAL